jgi:AmiR/NasT family two-component response regulator
MKTSKLTEVQAYAALRRQVMDNQCALSRYCAQVVALAEMLTQ